MATIDGAMLAAAVSLASVSMLGAGMFVAYAARIFRKWRRADELDEPPR